MIAYLRANPNVRYVIVYALSRFARNRYDDAVMMTLETLGVTLVSTTERNLDESPSGRAMHGMIAVFNEYQVLVSGEDIRYKMGQKVKNGGSVGVAKIGYRNVRVQFDGREVRTIDVDPDRAPFVRMAFELYATGNYGFHDLRDALTDAGLRTKGTRRYGPRPISLHSLGNLLRDRYYLGYVTHDGIEYPGRHEPLVTPEVFDRVQLVLDVERGGGTRERVHDHYLKGTIWCGRCRRRLILRPSTGKSGRRYFYFICRGNQEGGCDLPSLPVDKVERAVVDHYAVVAISGEHRKKLETLAADAVADAHSATARLRTSLRAQLADLDRQEDRYLDLIGDPDWPQDKIKARLQKVREDKQKTAHQLDNVLDDLTPGQEALRAALELLDRPRALYQAAPDDARKKLNRAIFNRLYLDAADRIPTTTQHSLIEPYASLVDAARRPDSPETHLGGLLATALSGGCASKAAMVELRGIEPLTFSMRTRRATNCATAPALAVTGERVNTISRLLPHRTPVVRTGGLVEVVQVRVVIDRLHQRRSRRQGQGRGRLEAGQGDLLDGVRQLRRVLQRVAGARNALRLLALQLVLALGRVERDLVVGPLLVGLVAVDLGPDGLLAAAAGPLVELGVVGRRAAAGAGHAGGAAVTDRLLHPHLAAQVAEIAHKGDVDGAVHPPQGGQRHTRHHAADQRGDEQHRHDALAERVAGLGGQRGGVGVEPPAAGAVAGRRTFPAAVVVGVSGLVVIGGRPRRGHEELLILHPGRDRAGFHRSLSVHDVHLQVLAPPRPLEHPPGQRGHAGPHHLLAVSRDRRDEDEQPQDHQTNKDHRAGHGCFLPPRRSPVATPRLPASRSRPRLNGSEHRRARPAATRRRGRVHP